MSVQTRRNFPCWTASHSDKEAIMVARWAALSEGKKRQKKSKENFLTEHDTDETKTHWNSCHCIVYDWHYDLSLHIAVNPVFVHNSVFTAKTKNKSKELLEPQRENAIPFRPYMFTQFNQRFHAFPCWIFAKHIVCDQYKCVANCDQCARYLIHFAKEKCHRWHKQCQKCACK